MSYIYALLDPRKPGKYYYSGIGRYFLYEPFYVGKTNTLERPSKHIIEAKQNKSKWTNPIKCNKILKILRSKKEPIIEIVEKETNNKDIDELECKYINSIGRIVHKTGPLTNIVDGGTGGDKIHNHPQKKKILKKLSKMKKGKNNPFYGKKHSKKSKNKLSKILKEKYKNGEIISYWKGKKIPKKTIKKLKATIAKRTEKEKQEIIKKQNSTKKKNENWPVGNKNPSSKEIYFVNPEGEVIYAGGRFLSFCKENKLPRRKMLAIRRGEIDSYRGWKCFEIRDKK